jgi:hypothetical protein
MDLATYVMNFINTIVREGLEKFGRFYSSYRGIVISNEDPEMNGRIKVKVPSISGNDQMGDWCLPKAGTAMPQGGIFHPPDEGAGVWVEFENGDLEAPIYSGGWWATEDPAEGGDGVNEVPEDLRKNPPTAKGWYTSTGHGFMMETEAGKEQVKVQWHRPNGDLYSFIVINKDGSIHLANHQGTFFMLNAADGEEGITAVDKYGNLLASKEDGWQMVQADGSLIELKKDVATIMAKSVVISGEGCNISTGGVDLGDGATEPLLFGNKWLAYMISFVQAVLLHTHPTSAPGAPTGPPVSGIKPPDATLLSKKNNTA